MGNRLVTEFAEEGEKMKTVVLALLFSLSNAIPQRRIDVNKYEQEALNSPFAKDRRVKAPTDATSPSTAAALAYMKSVSKMDSVVFLLRFTFKQSLMERAKKKPTLQLPEFILRLTTMVRDFLLVELALLLTLPGEKLGGRERILFLSLLLLSSMLGLELMMEILVLFLP